nr:ribonuclease H-like domain-containing protein [Tanacetum cinerariifolium]
MGECMIHPIMMEMIILASVTLMSVRMTLQLLWVKLLPLRAMFTLILNLLLKGIFPHNISQGQPDLRRSSGVPKVPAKFNDYVVNSSKKYGLEKYVTYNNLNTLNYCFSINLNKSSEPTSYFEAVENPNWIEAMNNEIEALNRNNTWTVCDLPEGKKAVGQRKYCLELLHEFGLLATKYVDTPLPENATLNHIESDKDNLLVNVSNYQRLVGKLIYLTNTRPDIAYVVHCLSQYMRSPLNSHLDAALRVLRYLKGSSGSGIQINKTGNLKLRAYADSDWARCHATRKSVSGYCVFLGDSLVTWKSKKQSTLFRSSAEAKYRSIASATCKVIWLSNLLGDMGVKNLLPIVMYCDNSSALQIAANPVFHEKTKHFEIDVHLVREKVAIGVIKIEKMHTTQQIADIHTKGLDIEQHKIFV